jgi:anti-sigma-K factor RskA
LGALSPVEAREFKAAMQANPELKEFVASLSTATGALAGSVSMTEPPPQLRAKILAQVAPPQKIVSLPERKSFWLAWLPWSLAACLAILCLALFAQIKFLRLQADEQRLRADSIEVFAQSLQTATNDLQQAVVTLRESNRLANLKIAMLNSIVADAPKAVAVSLWDNEKQDGVFVAENLKPLPADKDYQLWVLENGTTPVDAGVFHVGDDGTARVEFKARQLIKIAGKFAVTQEIKGGVASPTIKNMVLASN